MDDEILCNDDQVPAPQPTQVDAEVAPAVDEYVPGQQLTHCNEDESAEVEDHVPAGQF